MDSGPTGATSDPTPTFGFSANEAGSSFQCRFDSDPFSACSGPGQSHTPSSDLADGAHTFEVRATDQAQNTDQTPASRSFTIDSQAPAAPQITDTDPDSPANDNGPLVKGSAEAGSTVALYQSPDCTGAVEATGSAGAFASPGLTASVADDATATFSATATDAVGNTSPCSSPFDYREDSTAPETQIDSGPTGITSDADSDLRLLRQRGRLELRVSLRLRPVLRLLGAGPKPHPVERPRRWRSHLRGQGHRPGPKHRSDAGPERLHRPLADRPNPGPQRCVT